MKKIVLIIVLCVIDIFIFYQRDTKVSIEKIDLSLNYNELGIVFLDLDKSNSLLLILNNTNILYIIDCEDYTGIKDELKKLEKDIDFIVSNKDIDIDIKATKNIVNGRLNINNIIFSNEVYSSISYNNNSLCINSSNCDYIYYTKNNIKINDNKVLFVDKNIKINDNLYKEWIDIYKLNSNVYTFFKISDDYQVLEIIKNI